MREREIQQKPIRHLDLDPVTCVESGTSLQDVVSLMRSSHTTCVLVCAEGRCIGIFTERDYLNKVLRTGGAQDHPVDEFMSREPKTLSLDDTVGQAIQIMNEFGFRNIPLVDAAGRCTGLVQIRNIIGFLAELYPEEVLNAPPRPETFQRPDGA